MKINFKAITVIIIIIAQFYVITSSILKEENHLKKGKEVILKLLPVDPRSIIQGDYVILNYEISDIKLNRYKNTKIKVIIAPDKDGVYRYKSIYKKNINNQLEDNDVIIVGRIKDKNIRYGIESFFVEELTGKSVERKAEYALVKISKHGVAKVIHLLHSTDKNDIVK